MRTYTYYNNIFKNLQMPLAYLDIDMLNQNIADIAKKCDTKNIRIASKSIRSVWVLKHILNSNSSYKGIMCYTGNEALFLLENGLDDLLLGYPIANQNEIEKICLATKNNKKITLMVDCETHLKLINEQAKKHNMIQPICIDLDMSSAFPFIHFGVMRSPNTTVEKAKQFIDILDKYPNVKLIGLMGYEAQIAGLGDNNPYNGFKNNIIKILQKKSIKEITERRKKVVEYIAQKGFQLEFVNAGGTGSIDSSKQENWVTEITVGSGFYSPVLFDYYSTFKYQPAAGFAVQIVRQPKPNFYTCLGGGYVASGTIGKEKQPTPYLPKGIKLTDNEGTGEVQTPFEYTGKETLNIGDSILFRYCKAGEMCERFNTLHLVENGKILDIVNTYRGDGKCFL